MNIEHLWYRKSYSFTYLLYPFALIFRLLITVRSFLYRINLLKKVHFTQPVIVIGNITVGGTGKTPFVIWLAEFLKKQGLKPGIVSRGVGSRNKHRKPRRVMPHDDPRDVGDEAVLITQRTLCPMVVAIDRVQAVKELLAYTDCNVVIADDGLQHYRLARDIEIAIIDGERGFGNGFLLPAGPLREKPARLKRVDFVIEHGKYNEMYLQGSQAVSLLNSAFHPLNSLAGKTWHAVTGIGNPKRFFSLLRKEGFSIIEHAFPDHHLYTCKDFDFGDQLPIMMTEKDAVKCKAFADSRFWYLPVDAIIDAGLQQRLWSRIQTCRGKSHV